MSTDRHAARLSRAHELASLLGRSRRRMWTAVTRRLEDQGESVLAWQLLNRLRCDGPMTQVELSAGTGQHPAGVSRLVDTLERQGEVHRERDGKDRRKLNVGITRLGRARLHRLDPVLGTAADEFFAPLDDAERRTLARLLARVLGTTLGRCR